MRETVGLKLLQSFGPHWLYGLDKKRHRKHTFFDRKWLILKQISAVWKVGHFKRNAGCLTFAHAYGKQPSHKLVMKQSLIIKNFASHTTTFLSNFESQEKTIKIFKHWNTRIRFVFWKDISVVVKKIGNIMKVRKV